MNSTAPEPQAPEAEGPTPEALGVLVAELEGVILSLARELDAVRLRLAQAEARLAGQEGPAP